MMRRNTAAVSVQSSESLPKRQDGTIRGYTLTTQIRKPLNLNNDHHHMYLCTVNKDTHLYPSLAKFLTHV